MSPHQHEPVERVQARSATPPTKRKHYAGYADEMRGRAARRAAIKAVWAASGHLCDAYRISTRDTWTGSPEQHLEHHAAPIFEAVAEAAQEIAAKHAGFKCWRDFESYSAARDALEREFEN